MMGYAYMSGNGWILMLLFAVLVVVPFWRLLPHYGIPSWVGVVAVFPLAALVLLWVMAFRDRVDATGGGA